MYNALKTPSFLRPASRPASPVLSPLQEPQMSVDRTARPLSKLSLSNFRRPSPSPIAGVSPAPVTQDGSYTEVLSLKFGEAVSKALAQPSGPGAPQELLGGRRPIPPGRGRVLGALIASEVKASRENPHLYRALLRTLHRPLSVLLSNLSSDLLPLLSSQAFHNPLTPTPQNPVPNATQLHALGLATVAGELLETFDGLGLGVETDMRGDGLKNIREGLVSVVKRVVDPLMSGVKNELMPLLEALETTPNVPHAPKGTRSPVAHPSIMTMQGLMPVYSRALARYATSTTAETVLASLLISLVWRGLVALSNRPLPPPSPPGSPVLSSVSSTKPREKRNASTSSPPATPPAGRFTLKLPPSRPPTPPGVSVPRGTTVAADARALYDLLSILPRPSADKETTRLAREAVDEAFEALSALTALLEAVQSYMTTGRGRVGGPGPNNLAELEGDLGILTADLPLLIALPVLMRALLPTSTEADGAVHERTVSAILGLSKDEYRKGCLSGFGRAEECAHAVGQRVLNVLRADAQSTGSIDSADERMKVLVQWLDAQVASAAADH